MKSRIHLLRCLVLLVELLLTLAPYAVAQDPDPPPPQGAIFEFTQGGQLLRFITSPQISGDLGRVAVIPTCGALQGFTPGNLLVGQNMPGQGGQVIELAPDGTFLRVLVAGWAGGDMHFKSDGRLLLSVGAGYDGVMAVGNNGAGQTRFASICCPNGITEDAAGNVYATSTGGGGAYIVKFSPSGGWQNMFGYVSFPNAWYGGLERGPLDTLYVTFVSDTYPDSVREFTTSGGLVRALGESTLVYPIGVVVMPSGEMFVADIRSAEDPSDDVVVHLAPDGSLFGTFSHPRLSSLRDIRLTPTGTLLVAAQLLPEEPPATCVAPPSGLISWWPGDGNALDIHGSNHGALLNGATFAPGKVGQGFALDGVDDTIRIEHNPTLKPKNQVTLDAWIKPNVVDGLHEIFRKEDANDRILLSFQPDSICFWGWDYFEGGTLTPPCLAFGISTGGVYREFEVGGPVVANLIDGRFHHVAATYDGAARKIYIDGTLVGSGPDSGKIGSSGTEPAYIGSSSGAGEFFSGVIDEVEIYDRALSAEEIRAIYLAGTAGKCKNRPPVANAGPDQAVERTGNGCAAVTLDGSASSDPDNDPLNYEWKEGENVVGTTAIVNLSAVPLGTHTYSLTVNDGKGGTASDDVAITVQDTQAPVLALASDSTTAGLPSAGASGAPVDVFPASGAAATDQCDANPTLAPAGSAQYPVGSTAVNITASDHSGHSVQKPFTVKVVYNFAGFLQPINNDGTSIFKAGRTIPVKFRLTAADGSIIPNAVATLAVAKVSDQVIGFFEEAEASGASNLDNYFRYDPTAGQYIYNLSTVGYTTGTYVLRAHLNDGTDHDVYVSVR